MSVSAVNDIFGALERLGRASQRLREMRRLESELASVGTACGDCQLWMTRSCPKEINVNGWNRGPSCATPRCDSFEESESATRRREMLRKEIAALY